MKFVSFKVKDFIGNRSEDYVDTAEINIYNLHGKGGGRRPYSFVNKY